MGSARHGVVVALMVLGVASGSGPTSSEATGVILPFWAGPLVKERYPNAIIQEHGLCDGDVAEVVISRMPPEKDEALVPEKVLELDKSGRVLRRWRMPIDTIVVGITGAEILVPRPYVDEGVLYIQPDGSFRLVSMDVKKLPAPTPQKCAGLSEFKNSSYVGCFVFRDLKDGTPRRLAYDNPCT